MGYPKYTDFESGKFVAAWEQAFLAGQREEEYRIGFVTKSSAAAFQYRLHAIRFRAKEAGHELGEMADEFMLRIEEREGQFWLVFKKGHGLVFPAGVVLKTRKEMQEEAYHAKVAEESMARILGTAAGPAGEGAMTKERAFEIYTKFKYGLGVDTKDVQAAASVLPELQDLLTRRGAAGKT